MPPLPPPKLQSHEHSKTPYTSTNHPRLDPKSANAIPIIPRDSDSSTKATHITHSAISIPSTYGRIENPPNPGIVVGATLGAVAGFLLLLYLLYLSLTSGRRFSPSTIATSTTPSEIVDVGFRSRRGPRSAVSSRRGRGDAVIVEESLTSHSHSHGEGPAVVEVIEEESVVDPPPSSRYRSRSRSSSESRSRSDRYRRRGVRGVDPSAYGGGSEFSGRS
ncbi:hypothetical protein BDW74DRAFT_173156 [Aspergillus multicolor]|uniref:uncharacterized protein n=1 Tax=Aspergillus multicolor TaxID=41759 RepID=UPI003CCCC262